MKIRNGFVSNSSSSSFIVYGFSSDDSINKSIYDIVVNKIREKDDSMTSSKLKSRVSKYLDNHGLDFCFYDDDDYDLIPTIGCVLTEGDVYKFEESLKKSKEVLSKFDKDHGTDFSKSAKIFSYYEEDY